MLAPRPSTLQQWHHLMEKRLEEEAPESDSGEMDIEIKQHSPTKNIFEYLDRIYTSAWNETSMLY